MSDLDAAVDFYQGLGLDVRLQEPEGRLPGRLACAEVRYNKNTLALLVPDGPGLVADFAADRGEGILGVSLKVGSLDTAHDLIEGDTGRTLPVFSYRGRERFPDSRLADPRGADRDGGVGEPLITPALFSQPSTHPDGEKREWLV